MTEWHKHTKFAYKVRRGTYRRSVQALSAGTELELLLDGTASDGLLGGRAAALRRLAGLGRLARLHRGRTSTLLCFSARETLRRRLESDLLLPLVEVLRVGLLQASGFVDVRLKTGELAVEHTRK